MNSLARKARLALLLLFASLAAAGGLFLHQLLGDLPPVDSVAERLHTPSIRIVDRHGILLYEILPENEGRHTVVQIDQLPQALINATIATEDRYFYSNPGVDWKGILRALWINLRGGEILAGGSTITQQVVRNLLLDEAERSRQSYARKIREIYLAWQLTRRLSKNQILELYLNQTYYGGMAYGVEAAAQTFFAKSAGDLDLAEAALIAGLPQAPALYNPYTDIEAARKRQAIVLGLMEEQGYISAEERAIAEREELALSEAPYPMQAPHFVMMVRSRLDELFSPEELSNSGGLIVETTLDLNWQRLAEQAVAQQLRKLADTPDGLGHNVNSAALVALDPHTGAILAMVGSPDYQDTRSSGAINMALAPRQPGSALKPILYALAFSPDRSLPWNAATSILDVSTSFVTHDGQAYTPANYDQEEHGPVLVREALASSLNIPAVITLDHIGLPDFFEFAAQLGLDSFGDPDNYDLSLALGGGDVRLLDLTAAYGAFANGGWRVEPYAIQSIKDTQGNQVYTYTSPQQVQVMDERVAWLISDILSDNDARTLGFGRNSVLNLDRPAAVKTGTTSNFHDNWTVGYTPNLVVGVWAGNTDYQPMRDVSGVTGAAPIWHQFTRAALSGSPPDWFTRPPGLVQIEVCVLSGLLPTPACPFRRLEWFLEGSQPTTNDAYYRQVEIDSSTGRLADALTPPEKRALLTVLDIPPAAFPWARQRGLPLLYDLLHHSAAISHPASSEANSLRLLSPAAQTIFLLTPEIAAEAQRIPIEAVSEARLKQVTLWVDEEILAVFDQPPYRAFWQLSPGTHNARAEGITEEGKPVSSEAVSFEVREGGP